MSEAERRRQAAARAKIADQQDAASRAQRRNRALIAAGSVLTVLIVVVVLVVVSQLSKPAAAKAAQPVSDAAVARQITSIPAGVFDTVGAGPADKAHRVAPLSPVTGQPPLASGGRPELLYLGAEYCPYCAAERWAMVAALSRFGTFSGLRFIRSSSQDVYSNTATVTFYGSSYASQYLSFVPVETRTVDGKPLQNPTSAQAALLSQFTGGSFPFVDVGNKYVLAGAQFFPSVLGTLAQQDSSHYGLTWPQIAAALRNPDSAVARQVLGAANRITAAICQVTGGQPGSVCDSASVKSVGGSI